VTAGLVYWLYLLFAAGGVALYLAMPRPEGTSRKAAAVIGAAAVAGLLALIGVSYMAPHGTNIFFYLFAAIALLAAGRVVTHPVATYSAVYFALVVLSVAVLLVMLKAEFLAVALVIIYAGAILVTYAFVIMLAQQSGAATADRRAREPLLAILASFVVMGAVAGRVGELHSLPEPPPEEVVTGVIDVPFSSEEPPPPAEGNTVDVGRRLFGKYVVVVQLAGLLLLVAMVGAIAISRKRIPADEGGPPPPAPGTIGREVPPF
jgi:NADH-quinone oxidoreductase subunit J